MSNIEIKIKDNSVSVLEELRDAVSRALLKCGMAAEGFAKSKITELRAVDTGNLRNSITFDVDENQMIVGTNVEYGPYIELGTGEYYPGGRRTPWVYKDAKGVWHRTSGAMERPFIKPAVADHAADFENIIKNELSGK